MPWFIRADLFFRCSFHSFAKFWVSRSAPEVLGLGIAAGAIAAGRVTVPNSLGFGGGGGFATKSESFSGALPPDAEVVNGSTFSRSLFPRSDPVTLFMSYVLALSFYIYLNELFTSMLFLNRLLLLMSSAISFRTFASSALSIERLAIFSETSLIRSPY